MAVTYNAALGAVAGTSGITLQEIGTYTPAFTATGGSPAVGDGTLTGNYMRSGKQVTATIRFTIGSTTNNGTGEWSFSLPFTAAFTGQVGGTYILDSGVAFKEGNCYIDTTTTLKAQRGSNGGQIGATYPQTWAAGDFLYLSITYEAA